MSWEKEVAALLAGVKPETREKFHERLAQLAELDQLKHEKAVALAGLDLVARALYQAQEMLAQVGIVLPIDLEKHEQYRRDGEMMDATYPQDAAITNLRAAIEKGLASGVSKRTLREIWDEAEAQHRERREVAAFTDAAARDVLQNTEWTETSVNLAQETMDALAGIKKGKGR